MPWPGAKLSGERGASAMRATTVGMAAVAALVAARARGLAELRCCAATQREGKTRHCSARQAGGKASEVQSVALIA